MLPDSTIQKILMAAKALFLQKGFDGTSMADIAKQANVTKSLIFHHFTNKENLWKEVKIHLLKPHIEQIETRTFSEISLPEFLRDFLTFRFHLYDQNPEIARLMGWQRLAEEPLPLQTLSSPLLPSLIDSIQKLQNKGKIRANLNPVMIEYLLMEMASLIFINPPHFLKQNEAPGQNEGLKKEFLDVIIDGMERFLGPDNLPKAP